MQITNQIRANSRRSVKPRPARLFLNGVDVGRVEIHGGDTTWGFGDFIPSASFARFAPIFGQWSLMMHADGPDEQLSAAAAEELRQSERELDALRASLRLENPDEWHDLRQVNIDGAMIEWRP